MEPETYQALCNNCRKEECVNVFSEDSITLFYCGKCISEGYQITYNMNVLNRLNQSLCLYCGLNCVLHFYNLHTGSVCGGEEAYACSKCEKYSHQTCGGFPIDIIKMESEKIDITNKVVIDNDYKRFMIENDFFCKGCMPNTGFVTLNLFTVGVYKKYDWIKNNTIQILKGETLYENNLSKFKLDCLIRCLPDNDLIEVKKIINCNSFEDVFNVLLKYPPLFRTFFSEKIKRSKKNLNLKHFIPKKRKIETLISERRRFIFDKIFEKLYCISYRIMFKNINLYNPLYQKMKANDNNKVKKVKGQNLFYFNLVMSERTFYDKISKGSLQILVDGRSKVFQFGKQRIQSIQNGETTSTIDDIFMKGGKVPIAFMIKMLKLMEGSQRIGSKIVIDEPTKLIITETIEKLKFCFKFEYNKINQSYPLLSVIDELINIDEYVPSVIEQPPVV